MNIWEFYDRVDDLIKKWEQEGLLKMAAKLKNAKLYGSTAGEILGEIGLVLKEFKDQKGDGTFDIEVKRLRDFVDKSLS
jgi:hypothetical protein